jgi:ABC-type multidrug transport system fused ATPase/permease subunit
VNLSLFDSPIQKPRRLGVGLFLLALASAMALVVPYLLKLVVDEIIGQGRLQWLWWVLGAGFAVYVIRGASRYYGRVQLAESAEDWRRRLRDRAFEHAMHQALPFHVGGDVGDRIARVHYDAHQSSNLITSILPSVVRLSVTLIGTAVILVVLAPKLALLGLLVVPAALIAAYFLKDRVRPLARDASQGNGRLYSAVFQGFDHIEGFKSYGAEQPAIDRVAFAGQDLADTNVELAKARAVLYPTLDVSLGVVILGVLGFGASWATGPDATITVGTLAAYVFYISRVLGPVRNVPSMVFGYYRSREALTRIEELLAIEQQLDFEESSATVADGPIDLAFDEVCFTYPPAIEAGRDRPSTSVVDAPDREEALAGVGFALSAEERVAILGPSGAGKSTVARMVPRLLDPDSGRITANDVPLHQLDVSHWRDRIGYVGQQPFVLDGTVRQNLKIGLESIGEEALDWAIRAAEVDCILDRRDAGLDLEVGRAGGQLSGGQARRVALARALVRRPDILVLDQLAADLGRDQCRRIFENIYSELDLSVLYVGHRVPDGLEPNRTLWMEKGVITGSADAK